MYTKIALMDWFTYLDITSGEPRRWPVLAERRAPPRPRPQNAVVIQFQVKLATRSAKFLSTRTLTARFNLISLARSRILPPRRRLLPHRNLSNLRKEQPKTAVRRRGSSIAFQFLDPVRKLGLSSDLGGGVSRAEGSNRYGPCNLVNSGPVGRIIEN
ncbi:P-loop containing nucleoside triphosphatehydrolases superfamily protein [Striga asiatica]|uniref:P-loop containing nucleoside triphosphatehydrolases superfamily protein n=1 Tax=Striga asiatica TaxID=4170 RepID=A0A5A7QXG6_STRAF|nr:P-loop containing nucleoside triphosphatehydrolases superfamily protein [Striga asiatica]